MPDFKTFLLNHTPSLEGLALERDRTPPRNEVVDRVLQIARDAAARPVFDPRTPDEIIGYNDIGLPE